MKLFLTLFLAATCFVCTAQVTTITPGQKAPDFKLENIDNKEVSMKNFTDAKGYIIVFTCNTCPYAKRYEQRIMELNDKYASAGFPVIAINPNDPEVSSGDSFDKMKDLAKSKHYKFPYLFDDGQVATNAYGARNTPHVFVVAKTNGGNIVQYTGAIDNDPEDSNPNKIKYVEEVINSLNKNEKPSYTVTKAIGCTVKRKS